MGRPFQEEIDFLPQAFSWACAQDIELLQRAAFQFSDRALLPIGSGGSFTAAAFAARLHTARFSRVAAPITPLDSFAWPATMGAASAALLISAEGKNKDILAAAREIAARRMPAAALTLTLDNPLTEYCNRTGAATAPSYAMPWGKDGYLATNSLVAILVLLLRAFSSVEPDPTDYTALLTWFAGVRKQLADDPDKSWIRPRVLVLHGEVGAVGAIDLESKLTESAFGFGQVANFRQFAHGRHLQLVQPSPDVSAVAFVQKADLLAARTLALLPTDLPLLRIELPVLPVALQDLGSVLAAMAVMEAWARHLGRDPGQPVVPQFGRELHALEVSELAATSGRSTVLGPVLSKWPDAHSSELHAHSRAAGEFISRLQAARFKAILCDFDGTFCDTIRRYAGLDLALVPELVRLLESGVRIGFATGRGDSLIDVLRKKLPPDLWPRITVGCYSGSAIFPLHAPLEQFPATDSRLLELAAWLKASGVIGVDVQPKADCGQMGLRSLPPRTRERARLAVLRWIADNGLIGWRVLSSGHSVDVLTEAADKRFVLSEIAAVAGADPNNEVLRLGDAGDLGGNDYELLADGFALSVDGCSPHPNSCWDLLPADRKGVQGALWYLQALECENATAWFTPEFLEASRVLAYTSSPAGFKQP